MQLVIVFVWVVLGIWPQNVVESKRILFYGDSITAGYGIGPDLAFPALLEAKLKVAGYDVEAVNAGLSGETSAGGLTRIDWMLNRPYDIFVLELGANDGLRGLPIEQTKQNLQLILSKVTTKYPKIKIVIAGMMVPPNMGDEYAMAFTALFPELAEINHATLIPFLLKDVAGLEQLNQGDGIHPNARGHEIIADNLLPVFIKIL